MKIEIGADELLGSISDAEVDELVEALSSAKRVFSSSQLEEKCIEAAEGSREDCEAEQEELLDDLRDLIIGNRLDDALLLIERTRFPRRELPMRKEAA